MEQTSAQFDLSDVKPLRFSQRANRFMRAAFAGDSSVGCKNKACDKGEQANPPHSPPLSLFNRHKAASILTLTWRFPPWG